VYGTGGGFAFGGRSMFTAGCVFRLDGVLVDTFEQQCRIWEKTAEVAKAAPPPVKGVIKALHYSPEDAIKDIFKWTTSNDEAREWGLEFDRIAMEEFSKWDDIDARGDAKEVLIQMGTSGIPCAVVSNLPLEVVEDVLNRTNIWVSSVVRCT